MTKKKSNPFSQKEEALWWAAAMWDNYETFGGYPNQTYRLGNIGFVNEVGNESTKYAKVTAYDLDKLVNLYEKVEKHYTYDNRINHWELKDGYNYDLEAISDCSIPWD